MKTVTGKILGKKQAMHGRKYFIQWDGPIAQVSLTVTCHPGSPSKPGRPQKIVRINNFLLFVSYAF